MLGYLGHFNDDIDGGKLCGKKKIEEKSKMGSLIKISYSPLYVFH